MATVLIIIILLIAIIAALLGTGIKIIASLLMTFYTFQAVWKFGKGIVT